MRRFLTAAIVLFAAAAMIVGVTGCKKAPETLYVYNWTYYVPDEVIQDFEKANNCKVVIDPFSSNEEMFAKIKAGGTGYDIVFPGADYVSIMMKEGMLEKLDAKKLPNLKNIDPDIIGRLLFDAKHEYAVPYFMGATGIAVNKEKVKDYEKSWSIYGREDLKNRITLLDDIRETMGAALKYAGLSVNSQNPADIAKAEAILNGWKENILKFDSEAFGKGFASEEYWVVHGWAENIYLELDDAMKKKFDFFIPKEGGVAYMDCMVLLKGAKHRELAHKFINYILDPNTFVRIVDWIRLPSPNVPARALAKETTNYSIEDLNRCELKLDIGDTISLYDKSWQEIRVGN